MRCDITCLTSRSRLWAKVLLVCLVVALPGTSARAASSAASAVPLSNIKIDGRLSDWPAEMVAYAIDGVAPNPSPMWGGVPDGPDDFSGRFHTGYDEAAQRLYLAIIVDDDEAGMPGGQQDACVVSLSAGEGRNAGDGNTPETRYFLSSEPGAAPRAFPDGRGVAGLEGVSRRLATTTVYEWALPLTAARGDSIGLRIAVIDGDGSDYGGSLTWGDVDTSDPGIVLLVREDDAQRVQVDPWSKGDFGVVLTGTIRTPGGEPIHGVPLVIRRAGRVTATVHSDTEGHFAVELLPQDYVVEIVAGFGIEVGEATSVTVAEDSHIELTSEALHMPDELRRAALRYGQLQSYSDTTQLRDESRRGHVHGRGTRERIVVFERPNRIRLTTSNQLRGQTVIVSDGDSLMAMNDNHGGMEYLRKRMPEALSQALIVTGVSAGAVVDDLVFRMLLADDPTSVLTRGAMQIRKAGEDLIDGMPTWIFELERRRRSGFGPHDADAVGATVVLQIWVGQQDYLIRQVVIEEDVAANRMARQEAGTRRRQWRHRSILVDASVPEGAFALEVPEGARLVENFGGPSNWMWRALFD